MNKPGRYKLRSYQVEGLTNGEFWWWEFGICENKNCWGPYERTLRFKQRNNKIQISHFKSKKGSLNPPEQLDLIVVHLSQTAAGVYSGITCPFSKGGLFWPLFSDWSNKEKLHVYVEMYPKKMLPENVLTCLPKDYPQYYLQFFLDLGSILSYNSTLR